MMMMMKKIKVLLSLFLSLVFLAAAAEHLPPLSRDESSLVIMARGRFPWICRAQLFEFQRRGAHIHPKCCFIIADVIRKAAFVRYPVGPVLRSAHRHCLHHSSTPPPVRDVAPGPRFLIPEAPSPAPERSFSEAPNTASPSPAPVSERSFTFAPVEAPQAEAPTPDDFFFAPVEAPDAESPSPAPQVSHRSFFFAPVEAPDAESPSPAPAAEAPISDFFFFAPVEAPNAESPSSPSPAPEAEAPAPETSERSFFFAPVEAPNANAPSSPSPAPQAEAPTPEVSDRSFFFAPAESPSSPAPSEAPNADVEAPAPSSFSGEGSERRGLWEENDAELMKCQHVHRLKTCAVEIGEHVRSGAAIGHRCCNAAIDAALGCGFMVHVADSCINALYH